MKKTFNDFLLETPICGSLRDNEDAIAIFNILSKDENIIGMVEMSDMCKPALAACVSEVEQYYDSKESPTFDLKENFSKQSVGRMVKSIIAPFGYEPVTQCVMPRSLSVKYFTSATSYRKTGTPTMKIGKKIVEIESLETPI